MTRDEYINLLKQVRDLAGSVAQASGETQALAQAVDGVQAAMKDFLPTKADGTAFTDEELHAAKLAAEVPFDNVIGRDTPGGS